MVGSTCYLYAYATKKDTLSMRPPNKRQYQTEITTNKDERKDVVTLRGKYDKQGTETKEIRN